MHLNIFIIVGIVLLIIFIYYLFFHKKYDCDCDLIEKNINIENDNRLYISNCSVSKVIVDGLNVDGPINLVFTNLDDFKKYCSKGYIVGNFIGTKYKKISEIPNNEKLYISLKYDDNNSIISANVTDVDFKNPDKNFLHENYNNFNLIRGILKTGK